MVMLTVSDSELPSAFVAVTVTSLSPSASGVNVPAIGVALLVSRDHIPAGSAVVS